MSDKASALLENVGKHAKVIIGLAAGPPRDTRRHGGSEGTGSEHVSGDILKLMITQRR